MRAVSLLDVNVLLALFWSEHAGHLAAQRWFHHHAKKGWATCPLTQAAFVRLSSNPAYSMNAVHPSAALALLEKNTKHPHHEFWSGQLSLAEAVAPFRERITGHQQIGDAYLLGLAMHRKARLITFDKAIAALLPPDARKSNWIVEIARL